MGMMYGDYGSGMMGYYGTWWVVPILCFLLLLGLVVLVWILVVKYWKDINKRR